MADGDGRRTADELEPTGSDPSGAAGDGTASAPLVFLAGGLLTVGSTVAFLADLVTGHDVGRSVALNAAGALVLVGWAAHDTLSNPDSSVDSRPGAVGTALLLFGIYTAVAALAVGVTSPRHGNFQLALWLGGVGALAAVVGILIFLVAGGDGRGSEGNGESEREDRDGTGAGEDSDPPGGE